MMNNDAVRHSMEPVASHAGRDALAGLSAGTLGHRQVFVYVLPAVCALVLLAYLPALSARAVFHDDGDYVTANALVQHPSWRSVGRFFTEVWHPSTVAGYYQPLTMTSLMIDRLLAGRHETMRVYHRTSLLLHVANAGLVAGLLYVLFRRPIVAAAAALLFGLHPITVDSVCWLSERKTVLASFFALGSLIAYVRYAHSAKRRYYVGCLLMYLGALLSKPITVPLPLVMLLLDSWPLARLGRRTFVEKVPLFALSGLFALITYVSQSRAAILFLPGQYSPWRVPLILCHNIVFYLHKLFWPVRLSAHYAYATRGAMLAGIIGTCALIPLLLWLRRRTRVPLTGALIFLVLLFPAMGIVSVTPVVAANRYAYLPSVGVLLVVFWLMCHLADRAGRHAAMAGRLAVAGGLIVLGGAETVALRGYCAQWRDTVTLCTHMLTVTPRSATVHADLARGLASAGRREEALAHFRYAIRWQPRNAHFHYNLATTLAESDDAIDEAIQHYEQVLQIDPAHVAARMNLASALLSKGRTDQALAHLETVTQLRPDYALGHYNHGKVAFVGGRPHEGLDHLRRVLELDGGFVLAMKDLAWFLATHPDNDVRDPEEAVALAERARDMIQGRDIMVLDALAAAYASTRQYRRAAEAAQKALAMATRMRNDELAGDIEGRLRLYEGERPYYEAPRTQLDRLVARVRNKESKRARFAIRREGGDDELAVSTSPF